MGSQTPHDQVTVAVPKTRVPLCQADTARFRELPCWDPAKHPAFTLPNCRDQDTAGLHHTACSKLTAAPATKDMEKLCLSFSETLQDRIGEHSVA